MEPRISVITLGVRDLEASVRFYRDGLGLPLHDKPPVAYFALDGTWLALYPRDRLADYAGVEVDGGGFRGVTLACNVTHPGEVDTVLAAAAAAGARLVRDAQSHAWGGRSAWFADLDEHLWEIVHNPRWPPTAA